MKVNERIEKYLGEGKVNINSLAKEMEDNIIDALYELSKSGNMDWVKDRGATSKELFKAFVMALKKITSKSKQFDDLFDQHTDPYYYD